MSRLKPFVIVGLVGLAVIRGASQDARAVLADADRALASFCGGMRFARISDRRSA